jgi:hypothetical protein
MTFMAHPLPGHQRSRLPGLIAVAACLGLALLNWRLVTMDIDISAAAPGGAETAAIAAPEGPAQPPAALAEAAFPETLARPLFRANRRPPDVAKPETAAARPNQAAAPAKLPSGLALIGVINQNGVERALLRSGGSGEGQWVGVGYMLDGWRLSRIESAGVVFEAGGRSETLSLFPQKDQQQAQQKQKQSSTPSSPDDPVGAIRATRK